MKHKYIYIAIFKEELNGFSVRFPDLNGCFTEGDTFEHTYEMCIDAIGLYIKDEKTGLNNHVPPSKPKDIILENDESIVLIQFDELEYNKKYNSKAIKKTLTIPSWLNDLAEKNNVNFSNILQNALLDKLYKD